MTGIVRFIAGHATWFYLACALAFTVLLSTYLPARREARSALFGLELEVARARQQRFLRLIAVTLGLAAAVFVIGSVVEPRLPAYWNAEPTPTPDIFATPPPTFSGQSPTPAATSTPTPTAPPVTLQPQPTAPTGEPGETTPAASVSPTQSPAGTCAFTSPADESQVAGEVAFVGTATGEQFLFYKLEAYGLETNGAWASVLGQEMDSPVVDGVLGTANFSGWAPGGYSLRLVVVDSTYNEVATCFLTLTVTGQ